jgi:phage terminase large subunit
MRLELPEKMAETLFKPSRWKVYYGGRGGGKSVSIARNFIVKGFSSRRKIICTREIQKSIQDSVHALLEQEIINVGLQDFFEVQATSIFSKYNGTEFLFAGLRSNINSIKSIPGLTDGWVEEAQSASVSNIRTLAYTIREPNSEIILSLNPDLEDDPIYQDFILHPPEDAIVCKINWQDNPWFPAVLRQDMEDTKRRSMADYLHIWEGRCRQAVEGAIFADELHKASEENRITRVKPVAGVPVNTFWDLGRSDNTAIWFAQLVGFEYRLVDYYQASGHKMPHYIDVLAKNEYLYGDHYLPHDGSHETIISEGSAAKQLEDAIALNPRLGFNVHIVPRIARKYEGIEAARLIFPQCVFDRENTKDGLQCLRHSAYRRDKDSGKVSKEPVHDIWSHGADAFMCMAQNYKVQPKPKPQSHYEPSYFNTSPNSWMGR